MEEFKSASSRLARLFKKSRDAWKAKSLDKQRRLRAAQVKIRDLEQSRERWKRRALEAEQALGGGQSDGDEPDEEADAGSGSGKALRVEGSHHELGQIQLTIQFYLEACSGCRSTHRALSLLVGHLGVAPVSHTTVLNWVYRLGVYVLSRAVERREDWIFVVDHTIALGKLKCLVVLGITVGDLAKLEGSPGHRDMELLGVEFSERSDGEGVARALSEVARQVGQPVQIVADHGSDLRKGIELFCQDTQGECVYTYDVSHRVATRLKAELGGDERWGSLMKNCSASRTRVQQTELAFLLPPAQRTKARFMNLDRPLEWAQRLLDYHDRGDFSAIATNHSLNWVRWERLAKQFPQQSAALRLLIGHRHEGRDAFYQVLQAVLGEQVSRIEDAFWREADAGYRRFMEVFGWVVEYRQDLAVYAAMMDESHRIQGHLKTAGLNPQVVEQLRSETPAALPARAAALSQQLVEQIQQEAAQVPKGRTWLASSDIIESVFGKYKQFAARAPLKEIGKLILTLPACVGKLSDQLVQEAMKTVRTADVKRWVDEHLGPSMLAKRREALLPISGDAKTV